MATGRKAAGGESFQGEEVSSRLRRYFKETRFLRECFEDLLIDPYTIALSKSHNLGLVRLFERSGLDHKDPDHWKYLLSIVAASLYPQKSHVETAERKLKWTSERKRTCFIAVSKAYLESGKSVAETIADIVMSSPVGSSFKPLSGPARQNWFANARQEATRACASGKRLSWFGKDDQVCVLINRLQESRPMRPDKRQS